MSETWNHVACPGCSCLCDDLSLQFDGDRLLSFEPACPRGEQWFRTRCESSPRGPQVAGVSVDYDSAIAVAVEILRAADYPLIYGLSQSATPGQRAAIALADALGGVADTTASLDHSAAIMALQEFGEVTCTLGEIRNRADLVIFWGCDPASSHPRHAERYSIHPRGRWLPGGRSDRTVVMIGTAGQVEQCRLDAKGTTPDITIAIQPGQDFETLSILRRLVRGDQVADVPAPLEQLVPLMKSCKYGVFFYGLGLGGGGGSESSTAAPIDHVNIAALLQLVAELNAFARFTARRMGRHGEVSGADNVLCWQTGYPFAVDFSSGYPRHNPSEFAADGLLARGDVDAAVLVGAETISRFSAAARKHLESIPTILLDHPAAQSPFQPTVEFSTAVYGLHASGTTFRMDNVPIALRAMIPTQLPTDAKILADLTNGLA
ncbi:formylmethanofuran dehydrogenase subunit B [Rosistilla oblonga]|uniref:formylmethanofuran dehydrogenase subunit B n=1 Tax=Rosistilla oblonga TaxID=2527990 RepID=UPI003A9879E2